MSAGRTMLSAGCITWWGFGPARDLFNTGVPRPQSELNVLLIGSGDPRHILKTIAGLKKTDNLHIWVIENCMEVVARQLLLLCVSLSTPDSMGLQEKTEVFLELFGNSEVRHHTEVTLKDITAQLLLSVTQTLDTDSPTCSVLDTSLLKFKERDQLALIFKLWQCSPISPGSGRKLWDARVRQHLGTRYDSRKGCFDWDLTMKLYDKGCSIINKQQYSKWRETGVAFELREGLYQITNQSLLSTRVFSRRGDMVGLRGYWGDIVSSPYLSFGVETENKELLKMQNNQHIKTAQDVSVENLQTLFRLLLTRREQQCVSQLNEECINSPKTDYTAVTKSHPETKTPEDTQESEQHQRQTETCSEKHKELKEPNIETSTPRTRQLELVNLNGVSVSFLSLDSLHKLPVKGRYSQLFNVIYCSSSMLHHLDPSLKQTAAPNAVLMVELAKYLLDLSKDKEVAFAARVGEIAKDLGFVPAYENGDDAYAVFTLEQS